ncbi:MAG: hypothetical protein ACJATE_000125 [Bacteroidia bacterium]|jgi:hypothetical protein
MKEKGAFIHPYSARAKHGIPNFIQKVIDSIDREILYVTLNLNRKPKSINEIRY